MALSQRILKSVADDIYRISKRLPCTQMTKIPNVATSWKITGLTTFPLRPYQLFRNEEISSDKRALLLKLEADANSNPKNILKQYIFLVQVVNEDPLFVIRRVESGKFAIDEKIIGVYDKACSMTSETGLTRKMQESKLTSVYSHVKEILSRLWTLLVIYFVYSLLMVLSKDTNEKIYHAKIPKETFEDVAGCSVAKLQLENLVKFLGDPDKYLKMGCKMPKGYLLSGPPGVGKTLIAKALAGEAAVPFYFASGSEFDEVFVGVGARRIRQLFEVAKLAAPSIIFIDEIDSIGMSRKSGWASRRTLNQLLSEMDGFEASEGVIVIAATNDAESLDEALTREGRFDVKVPISLPTAQNRHDILKVHSRNKNLHPDIDLESIAKACTGMTGAQLATMMNVAAIRAVKDKREYVMQDDLVYARAKVVMGSADKSVSLTDDDTEVVAYHEAGVALLHLLREDITKHNIYIATIEPRGPRLGNVQTTPKHDFYGIENKQLLALIDVSMAGRIAEEILHRGDKNKVSTICIDDMSEATRIAEVLIRENGYSSKLGFVRYPDSKMRNAYIDSLIQEEVKELLSERYELTKKEIVKHEKELKNLASALIQYVTLTGSECKDVFNGRTLIRQPHEQIVSS